MLPEAVNWSLLSGIAAVLVPIAGYVFGKQRGRKAKISLESELRDALESRFGIPDVSDKRVDKSHIGATVEADAPQSATLEFDYLDGTYFAPDPDDIDLIINVASITRLLPYRPERYDCENFAGFAWTLSALVLGINTVGLVVDYSGSHAYNVVVDAEGNAHWFEPQTGKRVQIGEENFPLENADIMF